MLFRLLKNSVTPALIASLIATYLVLIIIVRKIDHHDNRKANIVRLVDNCPFDRQKYYISLETGFRKGAGTTAKVWLLAPTTSCLLFTYYLML